MAPTELSPRTPRTNYDAYLEPAFRRRKSALYVSLGIGALPVAIVLFAVAPNFDLGATLGALSAVAVLVLVVTAATVAFVGQDVTIGRRLLRDGELSEGEIIATGQYASGQGTVDVRFVLADGSERVQRFRLATLGDDAAKLAGQSVPVLALGSDGPFGVVLGELGIVTTS